MSGRRHIASGHAKLSLEPDNGGKREWEGKRKRKECAHHCLQCRICFAKLPCSVATTMQSELVVFCRLFDKFDDAREKNDSDWSPVHVCLRFYFPCSFTTEQKN